jgi:hypothetical protein
MASLKACFFSGTPASCYAPLIRNLLIDALLIGRLLFLSSYLQKRRLFIFFFQVDGKRVRTLWKTHRAAQIPFRFPRDWPHDNFHIEIPCNLSKSVLAHFRLYFCTNKGIQNSFHKFRQIIGTSGKRLNFPLETHP